MNEALRNKIQEDHLADLMYNLRGLCSANGHDLAAMLRVAHHKVHDEEILQEAPGSTNPTLDAAKKVIRLKNKVEGKDWWNDPVHKEELEERRRRHRDGEDSNEAFLEEVKRLFQAVAVPKSPVTLAVYRRDA